MMLTMHLLSPVSIIKYKFPLIIENIKKEERGEEKGKRNKRRRGISKID